MNFAPILGLEMHWWERDLARVCSRARIRALFVYLFILLYDSQIYDRSNHSLHSFHSLHDIYLVLMLAYMVSCVIGPVPILRCASVRACVRALFVTSFNTHLYEFHSIISPCECAFTFNATVFPHHLLFYLFNFETMKEKMLQFEMTNRIHTPYQASVFFLSSFRSILGWTRRVDGGWHKFWEFSEKVYL